MLLGGRLHGCIRRPTRNARRIPEEPSLQIRPAGLLTTKHAQHLPGKVGAYSGPPTEFEASTASQLRLPQGVSTPEWVTDTWTQGSNGLQEALRQPADLLRQLQTQLSGIAAGDGGPSVAARLQGTLGELRDSLSGALAAPQSQLSDATVTVGSEASQLQEALWGLRDGLSGFLASQQAQARGGVDATTAQLRDGLARLRDGLSAALPSPQIRFPGEGVGSAAGRVQDGLAGLRDGLSAALASASESARPKGLDSAFSGLSEITGTSTPRDPHFGSSAIRSLLDRLSTSIPGASPTPQPLESLQALARDLEGQVDAALQQLAGSLPQFGAGQGGSQSGLSAAFKDFTSRLEGGVSSPAGLGHHSSATVAAVCVVALALIAYSRPPPADREPPEPLPRLEYDIHEIGEYWAQRPVAVARRSVEVAIEGLRWGTGLGLDMLRGTVRQNAAKRAARLRGVLERLGPAYVKIAQAVSTRVDLLEPEYLVEIELLQDRVPPFPNEIAEETMQRAFGRPSSAIFSYLSSQPVAAASLGQVYRGRLQPEYGGGEIAVKVQRPGVLLSVALDLFLMRWVAEKVDIIYDTRWTGIIDEWAGRFFHELDYSREARNAVVFREQMVELQGITVPDVYQELCSQEVLTTAWVQGEKLGESNAADVRELCSTLLNCYLMQLLDTGFLHADPHPGNLLRTPDGKICILDFGLMTEISADRSIALVEYIAHLTTEDYEKIPEDLYKLGFIPEGAPDPISSGLVQPLSRILKQLSKGGGAKEINIDEVIGEMEELTKTFPFQIPSYFALILRAFSVIEGIALRVDPTYAIVPECFPYMSRRLFTDNSPRVKAALQQMLYGNKRRLDVGRLQRLATGFGNYTDTGLTNQTPANDTAEKPILNDMSVDALRILFSRNGSYVQEVFVDESAAAVDAIGREVASQVSRGVLGSVPAMASRSLVQSLGPLRPLLLPVPTPLELLNRLAPVVQPTAEDQEALYNARSLLGLVNPPRPAGGVPDPANFRRDLAQAQKLARELQPLLPELLPGILLTGELFVRALIRRIALRIAEEASQRPETAPQGAQGPYAATTQPNWFADAIASSPLWLLLPSGAFRNR